MNQQNKDLNELLKWSIAASAPAAAADGGGAGSPSGDGSQPAAPQAPRAPNAEAIRALMGGPSEADLMVAAMAHVTGTADGTATRESKLTALDNLEQLVESMDNANLLAPLGLWTPLVGLLGHDDAAFRCLAAWCIGTAVQNNPPCQERLVALGGVERLVAVARGERVGAETAAADGGGAPPDGERAEHDRGVRKKAVFALSSACRNYQPAMNVVTAELGKRGESVERVDAGDMEAVDAVINRLREQALGS